MTVPESNTPLDVSRRIHQWRWRRWVLFPTIIVLLVLPVPDALRFGLGLVVVVLLYVPFLLNLTGHFLTGYRRR